MAGYRPRCVLAMPPGAAHEARDAFLRAKYRAGLGALAGTEAADEAAAQWEVRVSSLFWGRG